MSKTGRENPRRASRGRPRAERHVVARGVQRPSPDLRKLSRAVLALALAEAEAERDAQKQADTAMGSEPTEGAQPARSDEGDGDSADSQGARR
ncbi:hypothetical protein CH254_04820 [Rhodococcus sp. 06-412-2C]|nr:hypothetical protein CH254_04820 [Rhodococcus sp. 06-412-2C]OZC92373.1 hypothetical protein CH279_26100 [Rhodococcus sp. 06-412-2B]